MITEVLMKNYEREQYDWQQRFRKKADDLGLSQMQFGSLFQKA